MYTYITFRVSEIDLCYILSNRLVVVNEKKKQFKIIITH